MVKQASKSQKREIAKTGLEVAKTRFQTFLLAKVCYSHENVRFENFMHMERSEEKFLEGIVGDKRRLCF